MSMRHTPSRARGCVMANPDNQQTSLTQEWNRFLRSTAYEEISPRINRILDDAKSEWNLASHMRAPWYNILGFKNSVEYKSVSTRINLLEYDKFSEWRAYYDLNAIEFKDFLELIRTFYYGPNRA